MGEQRVLVVTGGHPFEAEPFLAVFDALAEVDWTHVAQPAARTHFAADRAGEFDCIVCYDMPGITFTGADAEKWSAQAKKAGWDEVLERSPENGKRLMELFTK